MRMTSGSPWRGGTRFLQIACAGAWHGLGRVPGTPWWPDGEGWRAGHGSMLRDHAPAVAVCEPVGERARLRLRVRPDDDGVGIQQVRSPFEHDDQISAAGVLVPGAAVGQRVRPHRPRDSQRRAHATAGGHDALGIRNDSGVRPQLTFPLVRPGGITSRDEPGVRGGDPAHRLVERRRVLHARGVAGGPDQHEIVEHDLPVEPAARPAQQFRFARRCVADDRLHASVRQHLQGYAAAGRHDLRVDARVRPKCREEHAEQAGIVDARGCGEGEAVCRLARAAGRKVDADERDGEPGSQVNAHGRFVRR